MDVNVLREMGFDEKKIEAALKAVGGGNVEDALNWLLQFPETLDDHELTETREEDEPKPGCSYGSDIPEDLTAKVPADAASSTVGAINEFPPIETSEIAVAKSIRCEDCAKILRPDEIEYHAVKTKHENYSECTEDVKVLTEEEKQQALQKALSLIEQRRATQEEAKRREEVEHERNRRKVGQELAVVRQKLEEQERKLAAEAKRKEKHEARMHRIRVLQDIERDKIERQEKFSMQPAAQAKRDVPEVPATTEPKNPQGQGDFDRCHLQIRLTNGDCLVETFNACEELSAVRLYIQLNRSDEPGPFTLRTSFPRRLFTEEDMSAPLSSLDLCPKSVLIVTKSFHDSTDGS